MHYSKFSVLLIIVCINVTTVLAEERRQHGVHEHGGGQLNVAIDQNIMMIDLSLPAMNVVGFEHPVKNDKDHDLVIQAIDKLRDGSGMFSPDIEAKCELEQVDVETALLGHHGHGTDTEQHADFDATYKFNCSRPSALKTLSLSIFKQFPGTQHLEVQLITESRQTGAELSAENPVLKLN